MDAQFNDCATIVTQNTPTKKKPRDYKLLLLKTYSILSLDCLEKNAS